MVSTLINSHMMSFVGAKELSRASIGSSPPHTDEVKS